MESIRLSVRALVAFSHFPPDIMPISLNLMEEGRVAHLACQLRSGAQSEVPLIWQGGMQGLDFVITGRMDLYDAHSQPPLIEEIKLNSDEPPLASLPEHFYQALCYGYILGQRDGIPAFLIRVSYVNLRGFIVASFEEQCTFEKLEEAFFSLLTPLAAWQKKLARHEERRDKSLQSLSFPYSAFRPGQREMAAQVYTAITRRRRLYATMPTGTGKSSAVLYPALKAMGQGLSGQIVCLTARGTARRAMEEEAARMRALGLKAKVLSLYAKEKLCPMPEMRCDAAWCPRAKGHFLRQQAGLQSAMRAAVWDEGTVLRLADRHQLCPFEFSLALSEIADVLICDYNYFFDPRLRIKRLFEQPSRATVLLDEAHNLPDRAREMLSGSLNGAQLSSMRREAGSILTRKSRLYRRAGQVLAALRAMEPGSASLPPELEPALDALLDALGQSPGFPVSSAMIRDLLGFLDAMKRQLAAPEDYQLLCQSQGKERALRLICLNITPHLARATSKLRGYVCYSATLSPLQAMRDLLGGGEEDACFELPSPFPQEHLLVLQLPVDTRFTARDRSLVPVAQVIRYMAQGREGKYIAFFPSYAYMQRVAELLTDLPLHVQQGGMDERERQDYLARFTADSRPLLALAVLGGVFSEGIDLPGLALIGVCVVGVGLPQVNEEREAIRQRATAQGMAGFDIAYRHPGMHKVLQAAGRLIRSEEDRGVLLLCDERFSQSAYRNLLPPHYHPLALGGLEEIPPRLQEFWGGVQKTCDTDRYADERSEYPD